MIEVEITLRRSSNDKEPKSRRSWRYDDFPHPVPVATPEQRRDFLNHLWSNIVHSLKCLDVEDTYGMTITKILDIRTIYP